MAELPDAKKWFTGFIDVTRWIKDTGTLIRLVLIVLMIFLLVLGVGKTKQMFVAKQPQPQVQDVSGGKVVIDNTQAKTKNKFGIFNFW